MADEFGIRVEGVRELSRALNRAGGRELTKAMGQANKQIGEEVIRRLQPLPESVGLGAGAKVRPSASARLVMLRAGGKHRDGGNVRVKQWGRRFKPRDTKRPHIVGTAVKVFPKIEDTYLEGIDRALRQSGLDGLT